MPRCRPRPWRRRAAAGTCCWRNRWPRRAPPRGGRAGVPQANVRLMVNFVHRFRAEYRQAHAAVQAGAIGRPVLVVDAMASGRSDLPGWVWDHETAGGGMMMYNGIHSLDRWPGWPAARSPACPGRWVRSATPSPMKTARSQRSRSVTGRSASSSSTNRGPRPLPPGRRRSMARTAASSSPAERAQSGFRQGALRRPMEEDDRFLGAFREFAAAILEERDPPLGRRRPARPAGGRSAVRSGAPVGDRDDRRGSLAWRSR